MSITGDFGVVSFAIGSAVAAYLATTVCAIILLRRSWNWRLKLLCSVLGLLSLCQSLVLLQNHKLLASPHVADVAENVQLVIGALCLSAVHLLNRENQDRKSTDHRLRLAEAESANQADMKSSTENGVRVKNPYHHSSLPDGATIMAELHTLPQAGAPIKVQIEEHSWSGMEIALDQPLDPDSPVSVIGSNCKLLGMVAYCRREGPLFKAGISIDSRFSREYLQFLSIDEGERGVSSQMSSLLDNLIAANSTHEPESAKPKSRSNATL